MKDGKNISIFKIINEDDIAGRSFWTLFKHRTEKYRSDPVIEVELNWVEIPPLERLYPIFGWYLWYMGDGIPIFLVITITHIKLHVLRNIRQVWLVTMKPSSTWIHIFWKGSIYLITTWNTTRSATLEI